MTNINHEQRLKYVGASESAALLGASPYATRLELWLEKAGEIPPTDLDDVERVQAGQFLEPAIAAWAEKKFSIKTRAVHRYIEHDTVRGMGASLDFETVDGRFPVEIKNVDGLEFHKKWVADGDYIIDAPLHILLQIQHQMACAKKDRGFIVACVGGNRLYIMEAKAREKTASMIEREIADFWASIKSGQKPPPDFDRDGSLMATAYPSKNEAIDLTGDNRMSAMAAEYYELREKRKAIDGKMEALKNEMIWKLELSDTGFVKGHKIKQIYVAPSDIAAHTRPAQVRFNLTKTGD